MLSEVISYAAFQFCGKVGNSGFKLGRTYKREIWRDVFFKPLHESFSFFLDMLNWKHLELFTLRLEHRLYCGALKGNFLLPALNGKQHCISLNCIGRLAQIQLAMIGWELKAGGSPEASPSRPVLPMLDSRWSMLGAGWTSSVSTGVWRDQTEEQRSMTQRKAVIYCDFRNLQRTEASWIYCYFYKWRGSVVAHWWNIRCLKCAGKLMTWMFL